MPAILALPWRPSVVMPACGPVRLIAATPIDWSAIDTRVALWCSPVASRTSSSRGSGSSVMAAARASSSSVVSPIADTTTTRSLPFVRSRAIRRATRLMRSAPATDDPPNFMTTSGLGMAAHSSGAPAGAPPFSAEPVSAAYRRQSRHVLRPRLAPAHSRDRRWRARRRGHRAHGRRRQPVRRVRRPCRRTHRRRDRDPARRPRARAVLRGARAAVRGARRRRDRDRLLRADRRDRRSRRRASTTRPTSRRRRMPGSAPTSRPRRPTCARSPGRPACSRPASAWAAGRRFSRRGSGSGSRA